MKKCLDGDLNASAIIARLEPYPKVLRAAALVATQDDARWKPSSKDWSILDICCHVLDEERADFRVRLRSTLENPDASWPPLAFDGVAEKRLYNERDLAATLDAFAKERSASVAWLRSLDIVDWQRAHVHPQFGPITAGDLLASWAAHDALHLRQIAKRLYGLAGRDGEPNKTLYAGDWTA